jgi:PIN domain nuclease of toxin-antitoxin system
MRLLLDTHALLWFIGNDPQLSVPARQSIEAPAHDKFVSAASLWEVALKIGLGKLKLPGTFDEIFPRQLEVNGFELLAISCAHLNQNISLPFHHRDPFDRLLIAQALTDDMTIVIRDPEFSKYSAKILW